MIGRRKSERTTPAELDLQLQSRLANLDALRPRVETPGNSARLRWPAATPLSANPPVQNPLEPEELPSTAINPQMEAVEVAVALDGEEADQGTDIDEANEGHSSDHESDVDGRVESLEVVAEVDMEMEAEAEAAATPGATTPAPATTVAAVVAGETEDDGEEGGDMENEMGRAALSAGNQWVSPASAGVGLSSAVGYPETARFGANGASVSQPGHSGREETTVAKSAEVHQDPGPVTAPNQAVASLGHA